MSLRELAFFGGWQRRTGADGVDAKWGNPYQRNLEIDVASGTAGLKLPAPSSPFVLPGVPMLVVNRGPGSLAIRKSTGGTALDTLTANQCAHLLLRRASPEDWTLRKVSGVKVGGLLPTRTYSLTFGVNTINHNLLAWMVGNYGYDGSAPVYVSVLVPQGVALGTDNPTGFAFDTGTTFNGISWYPGSLLMLVVRGWVCGCPGNGGAGGDAGTSSYRGQNGQAGGTALRLTIAARIDCSAPLARIMGGGGGGGGGGAHATNAALQGGGGGGGRGVRMTPRGGGSEGVFQPSLGGAAYGLAEAGGQGNSAINGRGGFGISSAGNGGWGGETAQPGYDGGAGESEGGTGGAGGKAIVYTTDDGPVIVAGADNIIGDTVHA